MRRLICVALTIASFGAVFGSADGARLPPALARYDLDVAEAGLLHIHKEPVFRVWAARRDPLLLVAYENGNRSCFGLVGVEVAYKTGAVILSPVVGRRRTKGLCTLEAILGRLTIVRLAVPLGSRKVVNGETNKPVDVDPLDLFSLP